MRPDAVISVFWMLSFELTFLVTSFTEIKRLFSYFSLFAIRVVSSSYWKLLILLEILSPACSSSSPAFHMMHSAYELNRQGDNIQPWHTPFPILNQSIVQCSVLTVDFDLHSGFSGDRSGDLVSPSLEEFSRVCCDPHSQSLYHSQLRKTRYISGIPFLFLWSNKCWLFNIWCLCLFQY